MNRTGSILEKRVAPDLLEERKNCDFDLQELKEWVYGGKELFDSYVKKIKVVEEDDVLRGSEKFYDMTREERLELMEVKSRRMAEKGLLNSLNDERRNFASTYFQLQQGIFPVGIHYTMFAPGIRNLCNDEQLKMWQAKAEGLREIMGCYAQTELGHGSNVQGLETTATFDKQTDEFVIHTPTISAAKFWPGDAGLHANHAIVFAKLMIAGKCHGVQPFMVQLRDVQTHEFLPGVSGGDVGPKIGYNSKDNGFLMFDQVRIPRNHLLQRYVEVDRQGNFKKKGDLRGLYSVMLSTRVVIVSETAHNLAKGLTIAIRYSAVRRQFNTLDEEEKLERKILDYQTQMHKLAPLLAYTYAFRAAIHFLQEKFWKMQDQIKNNDYSLLELCHHLSAGFKSLFTTITYQGLEQARVACGGAGFAAWSGLPFLVQVYSPNTTFEGDNTLMAQQASRLIMKNVINISRGMKATGLFAYLNEFDSLESKRCPESLLDADVLEEALKLRAAYSVQKTVMKMAASPASQKEKVNSIFGLDLVRMTHLHVRYVTYKLMREDLEINKPKCGKLQGHLGNLLLLLGLYELHQDNQNLYECGYFGKGADELVNETLKEVYIRLRPQMVPLIEGWHKTDNQLMSAIGNSYGDIYETQLRWAKESRLNKHKVFPGIKENILPILHGKL